MIPYYVLSKRVLEMISFNTLTESTSMKRCITRLTQGIFEMSASLKPVFSTSSCTETALYTARDEKQKEKKTKNDHTVIRITVQIQVHAHNESQLPNILVSVTTLLQCSVVYTGNYFFFSTHECQRKKEQKMSRVLRAKNLLPDPGTSVILNWIRSFFN